MRWLAAGAALCALWACNTPYIPVPPPLDPSFTAITVDDGMGGTKKVWEVAGPAVAQAANGRVSVFNIKTQTGVIAKAAADGSYVTAPLDGVAGDNVEISYVTPKGEQSGVLCRKLADGPSPHPFCD